MCLLIKDILSPSQISNWQIWKKKKQFRVWVIATQLNEARVKQGIPGSTSKSTDMANG